MADSCVLIPCVYNKLGEVVESKLWNDLYNLTNNDRVKTKKLYSIGVNPLFLEDFQDLVVLDENGLITAHSLIELSNMEYMLDDVLEALLRKYKQNDAPYDEQIEKVKSFNSTESYKDDYVPVLTENEDGTYHFTLDRRTEKNTLALLEVVESNNLSKVLIKRLKELGVAYDFVGSDKYNGRFSTKNAEKGVDGLYHLILISQGANVDAALAEECAHLATLSMRDSTMIKRLLAAINDKTVNELFTDEEITEAALNTEDGRLELAGKLVLKAFLNESPSIYKAFLDRVKSSIYNVFSALNLLNILSDKFIAKQEALAIAKGFLYSPEKVDINKALENPRTLFALNTDNVVIDRLKTTMRSVRTLANDMENISKNVYDTYINIYKEGKDLLSSTDLDALNESECFTIMSTAISLLASRLSTLLIDPEIGILTKDAESYFGTNNLNLRSINQLYEAKQLYETLTEIIKVYLLAVKEYSRISNPTQELKVRTLYFKDIIKNFNDVVTQINGSLGESDIATEILDIERMITANFFEQLLGAKAYHTSARIVSAGLFKGVERKKEADFSVSDLATKYCFRDYNWLASTRVLKWIRTGLNAIDVTTLMLYDAIRRSNINAQNRYNEKQGELALVKVELKELGVNIEDLIEYVEQRDDKGNVIGRVPSGYFISKYKEALFNQDKRDVLDKIQVLFLKSLSLDKNDLEEFKKLSRNEKLALFQAFYTEEIDDDYAREAKELWDNFELEAYTRDDDGNLIFKDKYINQDMVISEDEQYILDHPDSFAKDVVARVLRKQNLITAVKKVLDYKKSVDEECLHERDLTDPSAPPGGRHFVNGAIPLYRASAVLRWILKKFKYKELFNLLETTDLCIDITSDDFGSPLTDTKLTAFNDPFSLKDDEIKRIPLTGINFLKDLRELSRNIFASLDMYTRMAYRFNGCLNLFSYLRIIKDTLSKRDTENENEVSKSLNRAVTVTKELNDFLVNNYLTPSKLNPLRKALAGYTAFVAIRLLAGSIRGFTKNFIAGERVLLLDAIQGGYGFDTGDFLSSYVKNRFNVRHRLGTAISILSDKELSWDKYLKLVNRWDSMRILRVQNKFGRFKPLLYITNLSMGMWTATDDALVAQTYHMFMDKTKVYARNPSDYDESLTSKKDLPKEGSDIIYKINDKFYYYNTVSKKWEEYKTGEITLEKDAYTFDANGNAMLRSNLLKSFVPKSYGCENLYHYLTYLHQALTETDLPLENDLIRTLINDLAGQLNHMDSAGVLGDVEKQANQSGFKNLCDHIYDLDRKELLSEVSRLKHSLEFTEDDEYNICNRVNDYIISSQGVYGQLNAVELQADAYTKSFGSMKGWLFGFLQRNFFSNESFILLKAINLNGALTHAGSYKLAYFGALALALKAIFLGRADKTDIMLRKCCTRKGKLAILTAAVVPFAAKSKHLRDYLSKVGWDDDQLNKLCGLTIGWMMFAILKFISMGLLFDGNVIQQGGRMKTGARKGLKVKAGRSGLLFKVLSPLFININEEKTRSDINKLYKAANKNHGLIPHSVNLTTKVETVYSKEAMYAFPNYQSKTFYNASNGKYYKWDDKKNTFVRDDTFGYFNLSNSNDAEMWTLMQLGIADYNVRYDTLNLLYWGLGLCYSISRGVEDEALSLLWAPKLAGESIDMFKPAVMTSGFVLIANLFTTVIPGTINEISSKFKGEESNGKLREYTIKRLNFYLKKVGLTYDDKAEEIRLIDWYDTLKLIDKYQEQASKTIPFSGVDPATQIMTGIGLIPSNK